MPNIDFESDVPFDVQATVDSEKFTIKTRPDFIFDILSGFTYEAAPKQKDLRNRKNTPELVKTLMDKGFYVQGSRSKLPEEFCNDGDWDLECPVYIADQIEFERYLRSLGFEKASMDFGTDQDDMYVVDINFKSYWHLKDVAKEDRDTPINITIIQRKNERLFRKVWEAITPVAFEQFVWKRSKANEGLTDDQIRMRRYIFMQTMYISQIGLDNYVAMTK